MVQHPADGIVGIGEDHLGRAGSTVGEQQPVEGLQMRQQPLPQTQGSQQPAGGMGDGVGTGPLSQGFRR